MKTVALFILTIFCIPTYSFNWDKCSDKSKGAGHYIWGMITSTYGTSEFVSSTGDCAMVGQLENDRKVFIAHNLSYIQSDASRSQGEYLSAYGLLSGCSKAGVVILGKELQENFSNIFLDEINNTPMNVNNKIERLLLSNSVLIKECKIKG